MNPVPNSIEASRKVLEGGSGKILRICLETNGSMATLLPEEKASLSLSSKGYIKFGVMEKEKQ